MRPGRIDALVDLAYGILIFVSVMLIISVGTAIGAAFGFGVLASYAVHVVWKMARFDPEWMTREVTETVERTLEEQLDEIGTQLEEVNERIDRRPKSEEFEEKIEEVTEKVAGESREPTGGSSPGAER